MGRPSTVSRLTRSSLAILLGAAGPGGPAPAVWTAASAMLAGSAWAADGDVPSRLNFQGRLTDSSGGVNGARSMVFRIKDDAGTAIWTSAAMNVEVDKGIFSVAIPVPPDTFGKADTRLEVEVDGELLSPSETLSASPYAGNAHLLRGRGIGEFVLRDPSGNVSLTGELTASKFIGDGSLLTGVSDATKVAKAGDVMTGALTVSMPGSGVTPLIKLATTGTGDDHPALDFEGRRGGVAHRGRIHIDSNTDPGSSMVFWTETSQSVPVRSLVLGQGGEVHLGRGAFDTTSLFVRPDGGYVGVGVTSPAERLDVAGNVKAAAFIGDGSLLTNLDIPAPDIAPVTLDKPNQRVGIGTTLPSQALEVNGTVKAAYLFAQTPPAAGDVFQVTNQIDANLVATLPAVGASDRRVLLGPSTPSTHLALQAAGSEKLRVAASGNVGIGRQDPGYKLDVDGHIRVTNAQGAATSGAGMELAFVPGNRGDILVKDRSTGATLPLVLQTGLGKVGVGVVSPTEKLEVAGNVKAEKFVGDGSLLTGVSDASKVAKAGDTMSGNLTLKNDLALLFRNAADSDNAGVITVGSDNSLAIRQRLPASYLRFDTGTNEVMRLTAGGNAGVGTTNPDGRLHVSGGRLVVTGAGGGTDTGQIRIDSASGGPPWYLVAQEAGGFYLSEGVSRRLFVAAGGNVGVGTTGPIRRLDVAEDGVNHQMVLRSLADAKKRLLLGYRTTGDYGSIQAVEEEVAFRHLALQEGGGNVGIGLTNPASALHVVGPDVRFVRNGHPLVFNADAASAGTRAEIASDLGLAFATANSERVRIDAAGNVGIGVAAIGFNTGSGLKLQRAGPATLRLEDTLNTTGVEIYADGGGLSFDQMNGNRHVLFKLAGAEKVRITGDGRVGIGITAPDGRLHVAGPTNPTMLVVDDDTDSMSLGGIINSRFMVNVGGAGQTDYTAPGPGDMAAFYVRTRSLTNAGNGDIASLKVIPGLFTANGSQTHAMGAGTWLNRPNKQGAGTFAKMATLFLEDVPVGGTANFGLLVHNNSGQPTLATTNDRVGIGTSSPGYTLDVAGAVNAQQVLVNGQPVGASGASFGAWETKSFGVNYLALTDGVVVASRKANSNNGAGEMKGFTDANSAPTSMKAIESFQDGGGSFVSPAGALTMPVRKGDYWRVEVNHYTGGSSGDVWWVPGSGNGEGSSNPSQWFNASTPAGAIYYNGGNVGIGIANPANTLHVKNNASIQLVVEQGPIDGIAGIEFRTDQATRGYLQFGKYEGALNLIAGGAPNAPLLIKTEGVERGRFDPNGLIVGKDGGSPGSGGLIVTGAPADFGNGYNNLFLWAARFEGGPALMPTGIGRNVYQKSDGSWFSNDLCISHQALTMDGGGFYFRADGARGSCNQGATTELPYRLKVDMSGNLWAEGGLDVSSIISRGSVGIGAAPVNALLYLKDDQNADTRLEINNNAANAPLGRANLSLATDDGAGDPVATFTIGDGGSDWALGVDNSDSDKFKIAGGGSDSNHRELDSDTRLTIDGLGNVGIGIANPGARLDVVGGNVAIGGAPPPNDLRTFYVTAPTGVQAALFRSDNPEGVLGLRNQTSATGRQLSLGHLDGSGNSRISALNYGLEFNHGLAFQTTAVGGGGPQDRLIIASGGQVGIGAAPLTESKLTVVGSQSIIGSDSNFGGGGGRALIDYAGYNGDRSNGVMRMGTFAGGGPAVRGIDFYANSGLVMALETGGRLTTTGDIKTGGAYRFAYRPNAMLYVNDFGCSSGGVEIASHNGIELCFIGQ